jgi:hypothetical protein
LVQNQNPFTNLSSAFMGAILALSSRSLGIAVAVLWVIPSIVP